MDDCHSASGVHLISWKCVLDWVEMKILDSLGMKYTHLVFCLLALLGALACTAPAFAQAQAYASTAATLSDYSAVNSDDPQAGAMLTIHKRVDEVNVLFIATDKHGKFVRDLNQNDFSILDDHKPPQSILNFRRETDLPLHLGLLIDVSGSVHGRFNFEQTAAIEFIHVPYKGGGPAATALLGGEIEMMFEQTYAALPSIQAGRTRPLAVTSEKRLPSLPNVPTMAELGYPQATISNWLGLIAPKGTPPPIVQKLNDAYNKALATPEIRERIVAPGNEVGGGTPEEFAQFIAKEADRWQRLIKAAGIKVE